MLKKLLFLFLVGGLMYSFSAEVFAAEAPDINCGGLPGCGSGDVEIVEKVASNIIGKLIQYVAVAAVIAVMISGVMYMLSGGEEEKTKKAKTWIIYSVIAVIISVSAWYIVNTLNEVSLFS